MACSLVVSRDPVLVAWTGRDLCFADQNPGPSRCSQGNHLQHDKKERESPQHNPLLILTTLEIQNLDSEATLWPMSSLWKNAHGDPGQPVSLGVEQSDCAIPWHLEQGGNKSAHLRPRFRSRFPGAGVGPDRPGVCHPPSSTSNNTACKITSFRPIHSRYGDASVHLM